ncbi:ABC transporter permease [uncultured Lactobacillus sp.]|uniref:ABC transporter permease n=1 Tax=uncultured Lactobacillus sp. TaxID=153152 RepID=UPI0028057904|nr:ABC transporter permease [uncultured Lactobacillus sp.]
MNFTYFKANMAIACKSKKNISLISLTIIFSLFFVLIVEKQNIGDGVKIWQNYRDSVQVNVNYFDGNSLQKKNYKATYDNLNEQSAQLANLQNGEMFDSPRQYLRSYKNLLNTMMAGYRNNYVGAHTLNVPSKFQIKQQLAQVNYLYKNEIPISMNYKKSSTYLIYLLSIIGNFLFFYILAISGDSWMINLRHKTLLNDIPYTKKDEVFGKIFINVLFVLMSLIISIIGAYLFAGFRNGFISLRYPVVFYTNKIQIIPLWSYIFIFLAYAIIMTIFITCLCLVLNQVFKNEYLTFLIATAVYALSLLSNQVLKVILFLPSIYLNINNLLSGFYANKNGSNFLNIFIGTIILIIWSIVLIQVFKSRVNKGGSK